MSTTDEDGFEFDQPLNSPHANQRQDTLEHTRVTHDDRPDELAVTPIETESGVLTTWITIDAADACNLEVWR
ncbi:DUF7511 domain-containing protein [Halomontanus rarus]|uniref:DUF7511 domain-containing protein n=1 Tax=Halomontanus rarus TaxID=3034020 RepID=UPI0023E7FF03|nr:hypothetical protein [Halovivax sp. TS33]